MSHLIDLDRARRSTALQSWLTKCRSDMSAKHKYPTIDFYSDCWPIQSKYKTKLEDVKFTATLSAFKSLDESYSHAMRCVAAERAIADENKHIHFEFRAWHLLARSGPPSIFDLQRSHLQQLENTLLNDCKCGHQSAGNALASLQRLVRFVDRLSQMEVIGPSSWGLAHETRKGLKDLEGKRRKSFKEDKASILDRQIEALSDATSALFKNDDRLSALDRAALATMGVMMCAPSRVNEPLCMAVDDVITIEDYAKLPEGQAADGIARVHMLLLQKGSKGASWGAKPALNFMLDLLNLCMKVLKDGGQRSRMLAEWYEEDPKKLYLPLALEHLRGTMIDSAALWKIINLSEREPKHEEMTSVDTVWDKVKLKGKLRSMPNPRPFKSDGSKTNVHKVQAVAWEDLESILLDRVQVALKTIRRVTTHNNYIGRVSRMLVLFDTEVTPYLPSSIKYPTLRARFKSTQASREYYHKRGRAFAPTIFEKLGLSMVVEGKVEPAWINMHDPRRWLNTQAMGAKERLSDVLLNKWANRLSISQLKHYDLRSDTEMADQAAMPALEELADMSAGLQKLDAIDAEYGLRTEIVVAHEAGVSVTSMEAVSLAVEDRPVARTSSQLIVLYPSRFGVCLHQHHETPCRAYTSCLPCSENLVLKGHLPSNEEIRKRHELLTRSIVNQLDQLVIAHNRQIADSPEGLEAHMLALVRQGFSVEKLADELINKFHEIKDRIKSPCLRTKMEEAFVARGMVQRLDDPSVKPGALMRYHNPSRHASPGHERALDARGGRELIDAQLEKFNNEYPRFAPASLGVNYESGLPEEIEGEHGE